MNIYCGFGILPECPLALISLLCEDFVCEVVIRLDSGRLESDLECWRGDTGTGAAWVCDDWRKELINTDSLSVLKSSLTLRIL